MSLVEDGEESHLNISLTDENVIESTPKDDNKQKMGDKAERKCDSSTAQKGHLRKHLPSHFEQFIKHTKGDQNSLACAKCNFSTKRKDNLLSHIKAVHIGLKPFKCDQCSYTANHKYSLQWHTKTKHGGEKDQKCPNCEFATFTVGALNSHMRSKHPADDGTLHDCNLCSFKSTQRSILKSHLRSEHLHSDDRKSFTCTKCAYSTEAKRSLMRHIKAVHYGLKPFKCDMCSFISGYKSTLQLHHKSKHGGAKDKKCPHCNYAAYQTGHLLKEHGGSPSSQFVLDIELESTENVITDNDSGIYIPSEINESSYEEDEDSVKCQICSYEVADEDSLTKHLMQEHVNQFENEKNNLN